jgi:GTPase SAR1 family protein
MILFEWIKWLLYALGLLKKEAAILLLGLDNAGKTTLLYL